MLTLTLTLTLTPTLIPTRNVEEAASNSARRAGGDASAIAAAAEDAKRACGAAHQGQYISGVNAQLVRSMFRNSTLRLNPAVTVNAEMRIEL